LHGDDLDCYQWVDKQVRRRSEEFRLRWNKFETIMIKMEFTSFEVQNKNGAPF
jgi:hypothetical protein